MVYVPGEVEQSKIVDDFGSFKYWRDPVPTLDLNSILQEVSQTRTTDGAVVHQASAEQPSDQSQEPTMSPTTAQVSAG